jgi:hypothetical protein
MKFDVDAVRNCLKSFDFQTLFREHLGWDNHNQRLEVAVGNQTYALTAVAQKRGFVAFTCPAIPDRATRLKIDNHVTRSAREHFVIYVDRPGGQQVWHWVRREPGKPLASRDHRFYVSQSGDPLIQRLNQIAVSLDEEERITVVDVAGRARAAFDVDRVTRRFYDRFKAEHEAFRKLIQGITSDADLQWYTSLMLNRLMFVYFIQKKGFLDGDTDYLRNRLAQVQAVRGSNKFHSFYRYFLLRLFHEGLGKSPDERALDPTFEKLLGNVPFLNGGFFEVHDLEARWPEIDIPDAAFEKLFDFFDQYAWHLDERPLRTDNEINPDVVGYIFEKYINQKQMGAYYTKEDITEYISKNTIIPFIFDVASKACAVAFKPDSALWRLLRDDPDRYIYPAVRHGVVRADGSIVPESDLPDFVQKGMHDPKARMHDRRYNLEQAPSGDLLRLATETWREYVYRRNRCLEIREKLRNGEVHQINDLITLNLDIWQFARDAIVQCEGPELLRAFWHAIENITVLDPTCGSGAFLFAALRILETLYSDCLERMERFVEDLQGKKHHPEQFSDFKRVLEQIGKHPNERYFILKSIIINNLYGVDIMEEAVEICKLRLFLKLAAQVERVEQIEPLPDIDFNIRAGNTLVGYATAEDVRKAFHEKKVGEAVQHKLLLGSAAEEYEQFQEDLELADRAFVQFRAQQTTHGGRITHRDKQELRHRLETLTAQLDRFLAGEYGVDLEKPQAFEAWKASHQPFHWFAEFYGIMRNGGFNVIIGNPPYVSYTKVRSEYQVKGFATEPCANLYAFVTERGFRLASEGGRFGMIVPIASVSTNGMKELQSIYREQAKQQWHSHFATRPGKLFVGVDMNLTITLAIVNAMTIETDVFSTTYYRWRSGIESDRDSLFQRIEYLRLSVPRSHANSFPKIGKDVEARILTKICGYNKKFKDFYSSRGKSIYYHSGGRYWRKALLEKLSSHYKGISVDRRAAPIAFCLLNSQLFYWYWITNSNCMDVVSREVDEMPIFDFAMSSPEIFTNLQSEILRAYSRHSEIRQRRGAIILTDETNFDVKHSKPIIDEIDRVLARHYGFTDEELDFIINYDIKYRMGSDAAEDEE